MQAAGPRLRLAVDITRWRPSDPEFDFLAGLLPAEDAQAARSFKFEDDRKRALVSRLLQRHAAQMAFGLPASAVLVKRTKGRKPYVANALPRPPNALNFNYSVSHEGDYVVLASEGLCLCGCDVAAPQELRRNPNQPMSSLFEAFARQLTAAEWAAVNAGGADDAARESTFRRFWSLKEAYVKAVGVGIAFDMGRCEFTIVSHKETDRGNATTTARVAIDGVPQPQWLFHIHQLGNGHWVSVGRGPIEAAVDAWGGFKASLQRGCVPQEDHAAALAEPEPPFSMLHVSDCVPEDCRADYEAAGGEFF